MTWVDGLVGRDHQLAAHVQMAGCAVVTPQEFTAQPGEKKVDEGSLLISYYTGKTRCSSSEDYAVSTTWSQRRMIIHGMRSHHKPPSFG